MFGVFRARFQMKPAKSHKIGLYIRVSTEEQARIQDGSLVSQKNRIIEYIEHQNKISKDWGQIFEFYCEEGKSAKNLNRPEFRRLLSDVQSGHLEFWPALLLRL